MAAKIEDPIIMKLIQAIVVGDKAELGRLLSEHPLIAQKGLRAGAGRENPLPYFFDEISHCFYAGDTGLHAAAAAYNLDIAEILLRNGANIAAQNRRGALPYIMPLILAQ